MDTVVGVFSVITAISTIVYVYLTNRVLREAKEEREMRRRPFVLVDFSPREGRNGTVTSNLRIRNLGDSPATRVKLTFDSVVRDIDDQDVLENPVLRDGIAFLPPGVAM